ncbi:MAG: MBL fold metallo-hydrolase [Tabrizicola sp.]|nr:MBL fold metallo-hydrolase [Tabrizicola sp.]
MRIVREGRLFCEVELGALSVIMLSDGETVMALDCLRRPDGTTLAEAELAGADLKDGKLRLPVRAFLVRGPGGCLLIDAGAGDAWHKGLGQIGAAMAEAGTGPQEVTAIALTHTHIDHVSGLADRDGGLAFPNAERVYVATEEIMAFRAIPRMIPLHARLLPLEQGDGPIFGVTAINAPGHSPGHMAYLVEGRLLIWGDLVHNALQLARPEIGWKYDEDLARARASRLALMEQAVEAGWLVAGAHLPGPGIGRIDRVGEAYAYHPVTRGP